MEYLWVLNNGKRIATFVTYDEAVEELNRLPNCFNLEIDNKKTKIQKEEVMVVPYFYPQKQKKDIYDHIADFLKTFYKQNV